MFYDCCLPGKALDITARGTITLGRPPALSLLCLSEGSCHLPQHRKDIVLTGDWLVIASSIPVECMGECRFLGLELTGQLPRDFMLEWNTIAAILPKERAGQADVLLAQLTEGAGNLRQIKASALAYSLLCHVVLGLEEASLPPLVEAALGEIREHYAEVYGVEELAETLMVSKSHLIRCFTNAVGTSPGRYLTTIRVENAKRLLLHQDFTIEVVANLCGFSGANYFCKVFKREAGVSPAAWRKNSIHFETPAANILEEQVYL